MNSTTKATLTITLECFLCMREVIHAWVILSNSSYWTKFSSFWKKRLTLKIGNIDIRGFPTWKQKLSTVQECIPVGCIPPTAVAVSWGVHLSACWDTNSPLGVGLETPRCGPGDTPLGVGLETPPGCGPGDPPQMRAWRCPWVWAWRPPPAPRPDPSTSSLGVGLETYKACLDTTPPCCKACWNTTCNACWDTTPPPPQMNRILDTRYWKYYLAPNFVCGR